MSKSLDALENIKKTIKLKNDGYINLFETLDFLSIEKELKALAIIKAIGVFDVFEDIGGKYHLETRVDDVGLMKEDYDLLKEVML